MQDWLRQRASTTPERRALVAAESGSSWDYRGLDAGASEAARRLAALGLGEGDHVGVVLPTRVEYVTLVHAAMRIGAVLVPLGHDLTAPELAPRVERADLDLLVCGSSTEATAVEATDGLELVSVDDPLDDGVERLGAVDPVDSGRFQPADRGRRDPLLLLYTSGTTGRPKLVVLTVGNVLTNAVASAFRLGVEPSDRWLGTLSMHHMGGIAPAYRSAVYGTTLVLRESFDPGGAADDLDEYDVTGVSLVPTMLRRMLDARGTLADSLRVVLLGGGPAPRELLERCRAFSVPVYPTYGMTETASQVATAPPVEAFEHRDTVGRPLFWTDVTVVADGEPVQRGEVGEFVVSGPTVTPGYYGDEPDPFGEYGFHTGDVGYRDEAGRLYVLNRLDDRIVTGGENVDPGEVADVLSAHPDVKEAAVLGLPDEEWGERVSALVVADGEPTLGELREFCRDRLASYKLPRSVAVVEELPRTVSGTVDRDAARDLLAEHAVSDGMPGFEPAEVEPADEED